MEQGVLLSDRLLYSAELVILVAGSFMLMDLVLRRVLARRAPACAGSLHEADRYQLFDGPVDQKMLRVHQMRYFAPLWPYDLAWNAIGLVLLAIGIAIAWRADQAAVNRS